MKYGLDLFNMKQFMFYGSFFMLIEFNHFSPHFWFIDLKFLNLLLLAVRSLKKLANLPTFY